ncbi:MAG: hypothetical protein Udaeo2_20550 [Candidatus Udaeobacter sp.]|nr:MAG: hypothetical protein Udaeo2_20550 [Candidatus Udaeobacter sp.]
MRTASFALNQQAGTTACWTIDKHRRLRHRVFPQTKRATSATPTTSSDAFIKEPTSTSGDAEVAGVTGGRRHDACPCRRGLAPGQRAIFRSALVPWPLSFWSGAVTVTTMDVASERRCQAPCFSLLRGGRLGGLVSLITRSKLLSFAPIGLKILGKITIYWATGRRKLQYEGDQITQKRAQGSRC